MKIVPQDDYFNVTNYKHGMFDVLLEENKIGTPTILVKKNILNEVGLFNETLSTLEDWELCLRIAEKGEIVFLNKILLDVYSSESGVNTICDLRRMKTFIQILSLYWSKYNDLSIFKNLLPSQTAYPQAGYPQVRWMQTRHPRSL